MRRPTFKPSQEMVPIRRTLMPQRSCRVSRTLSTPSSMKLIGLI
jgi:hypothetical protein